ncbi:MAG: hypothetical protein CVU48_08345 [Candidatus Cloacimonetes bacterium HGW-Cloacimonetes-1]|nr:MAG: hypothetical protein CVU48_08345 [Candidatus Cloacimonetes bacterium HGW-Cloacimonetes-1]
MQPKHPVIFTIDVEDYYHILDVPGTPRISDWDQIPSRVEYGFNRLLDLLVSRNQHCTMFFLGYIARRFPDLVKRAREHGHEIASHGMYHTMVSKQTAAQFATDATDSRQLLEDLCGTAVTGWRSAGFSPNLQTSWYFEELVKSGYRYDSSLVPNRTQHQSLGSVQLAPYPIHTPSGRLLEFPISVATIAGRQVNMFGGGYLRFFPAWLIAQQARKVRAERPLIVYIHPRELDPGHPKLRMNALRHCKSYINMNSVPAKLHLLLDNSVCVTAGEYYNDFKWE